MVSLGAGYATELEMPWTGNDIVAIPGTKRRKHLKEVAIDPKDLENSRPPSGPRLSLASATLPAK